MPSTNPNRSPHFHRFWPPSTALDNLILCPRDPYSSLLTASMSSSADAGGAPRPIWPLRKCTPHSAVGLAVHWAQPPYPHSISTSKVGMRSIGHQRGGQRRRSPSIVHPWRWITAALRTEHWPFVEDRPRCSSRHCAVSNLGRSSAVSASFSWEAPAELSSPWSSV